MLPGTTSEISSIPSSGYLAIISLPADFKFFEISWVDLIIPFLTAYAKVFAGGGGGEHY